VVPPFSHGETDPDKHSKKECIVLCEETPAWNYRTTPAVRAHTQCYLPLDASE